MSRLEITSGVFDSFDYDKRKNKWILVSDGKSVKDRFNAELVEFLEEKKSIDGYAMLSRATEIGDCLDQHHAEAILRNSEMIPEDWRRYILVFPGTVWCDHNGYHLVSYLSWNTFGWYLNFYWLDLNFNRIHRFVRLGK